MNSYLFILLMLSGALLFQNCSSNESSFSERTKQQIASDNNDADGDHGLGGGGFPCVEGDILEVYLDPDSTGAVVEENYLGSIVSYTGSLSSADNYNYYSASAHPVKGPNPVGFEAKNFFYNGTDGLSYNFFANVDEAGSADNSVDVDIQVEGNSLNDSVLLSDDAVELEETSPAHYEGRFRYWYNTDGGVIGPLQTASGLKVKVQFLASGDVTTARFYSANGFHFSIDKDIGEISSFVMQTAGFNNCSL